MNIFRLNNQITKNIINVAGNSLIPVFIYLQLFFYVHGPLKKRRACPLNHSTTKATLAMLLISYAVFK